MFQWGRLREREGGEEKEREGENMEGDRKGGERGGSGRVSGER